jgi:hypothetical protein
MPRKDDSFAELFRALEETGKDGTIAVGCEKCSIFHTCMKNNWPCCNMANLVAVDCADDPFELSWKEWESYKIGRKPGSDDDG